MDLNIYLQCLDIGFNQLQPKEFPQFKHLQLEPFLIVICPHSLQAGASLTIMI